MKSIFRIEKQTGKLDKPRRELLRSRLLKTNTLASPALRELRGTAQEREVPLQLWVFPGHDADKADVTDANGAHESETDGELLGGLDAHVWARWLHVDFLWVDARHRGTGLGTRLLADAERIAREEYDCQGSRLCTWDFQAPDFYRKFGYTIVCTVPDYPPGITEYTLTKSLV